MVGKRASLSLLPRFCESKRKLENLRDLVNERCSEKVSGLNERDARFSLLLFYKRLVDAIVSEALDGSGEIP